ncbi:multiple sugar transport system substrate-binding protein [Microlunatus panaciterrae]|uniref:Multiple sugar transport system substrate-binding protein n=1 Tax=Microlunatus panaciterrae TaxID=400768 RepID=A0ABS2RPN3_9ACTN|nr:extracellular solute-binding protein [Microlunatus panaciterrae]MBM7800532.1 multiple sugar transport system substrate-binding protein [Microlunatus panaciterrae]
MHFPRRRLLQGGLGIAAGVLGGGLSACGSSSSAQTPKGFTEVTFSSIGDTTAQKMFKDMIAAAQKESLDEQKIKIVWKPAPGDDWASVMLQFASGTTSDIQRIDDDRVYDLATSGKILQLDKMMLDPSLGFDLSKYSPSFATKVAVEGYQFSVTPAMSANVLYYNKKLFNDAGLTAPTSWSEAWSWDEFDAAVKKLTKKSGNRTDVYGVQFAVNTIQATAYGAGDVALNAEQTECGYSKPETLEAIDKQVSYIREGYAPTVDVDFLPLFNAGKLAMTWQGMDLGAKISKSVEWDIMPWPKTPLFAMTKNYARTWVIPKTAKDPQAAFLALKALSGKAASEVMAKAQFAVPALTEVAKGSAFTDHPYPTTPSVWAETLGNVKDRSVDIPFPRGPIGTALADSFVEGVNANGLMSGKLSTADYIKIGRAAVNAEIKKRNWDVSQGKTLLEKGGSLTDPDTKVLK